MSSVSTSQSAKLKVAPATIMQGLTQAKLDNDPVLLDYVQSNFPNAFEVDEEQEDPVYEQLRYLGYSLDPPNSYRGKKTKAEKAAFPGYPRNIRPMTAYIRDVKLDRNTTRLRNHLRLIPGIVFGSDPTQDILSCQGTITEIPIKTPWGLLERELRKYAWNFESRVYELTVKQDDNDEGTVHCVVPSNVNRHPLREFVFCCNFLRYHSGRPLQIPYQYINTEDSPALKREGFVVPITRKIEVFVEDGAPIPEFLPVDCTGVRYRESIRLDRVILPDGVRFSDRVLARDKIPSKKWIVGVVFGGSKGKNAALEEAEAATTKATAASKAAEEKKSAAANK